MDKVMKKYVIAVDGEPAAGKGTLAIQLANALGISYMDTGAMYRAVGVYFLKQQLSITEENILAYIDQIHVILRREGNTQVVLLNGEDITDEIRTNEASMAAKTVSKNKIVRAHMVALQREMAEEMSIVVDGQDIGTVVFPQAAVKLFIKADLRERARRRLVDFHAKGEDITLEQVIHDLAERTYDDYHRKESPLTVATDATVIDNTNLSKEETLAKALEVVRKRVEA